MIEFVANEIAESKKAQSFRGRQTHIASWRKELPSRWLWYDKERSYYDHLRTKAHRRVGCASPVPVSRHRFSAHTYIPSAIRNLREVIESSRTILKLQNDWDEQGSPGYSGFTWKRVEKFLTDNALQLWRRHKTCFEPPRVLPGPDGSIDLHWRTPKRELLINVPASSTEQLSYYGDDIAEGTENAIRGKKLDTPADAEWIFLWLMN